MINLTNLKLCLIRFVYFFSRHQVLFSVYFLLFEECCFRCTFTLRGVFIRAFKSVKLFELSNQSLYEDVREPANPYKDRLLTNQI